MSLRHSKTLNNSWINVRLTNVTPSSSNAPISQKLTTYASKNQQFSPQSSLREETTKSMYTQMIAKIEQLYTHTEHEGRHILHNKSTKEEQFYLRLRVFNFTQEYEGRTIV